MRRKALVIAVFLAWSVLAPNLVFAATDTVGVYRPSDAAFYLRETNTSGWGDMMCFYGADGDKPLAGDWDGNGFASVGIFRDGVFHLRNNNNTGPADLCFAYGMPGDIPIMGDWDGNGTKTIGIYRGNSFHLRNTNNAGPADVVFTFGEAGDLPVAGDWNSDGIDTVGVYRNGVFYLKNSNTSGEADLVFFYGIPGDLPIAGDWDGNGTVTIGIYRPSDGLFHLRNNNAMGFGDIMFVYGIPGDLPVAGSWEKQTLGDPVIDSFNAEPQSITPGNSATLTWSITNATSASIDNGVGNVNTIGGSIEVTPNVTTTYTLSATNASGTVTAQTTVTVTPATAPVISSFSAQPTSIDPGGSSTLSWSIEDADTASIDQGVGSVDPSSGTIEVSPSGTTTYTLIATNSNGTTTAQATVEVDTGLPPDPSEVAPELDNTVATTLITSVEFLYTGDNPIQTGVLPETIKPERLAVLRGKVMNPTGDPLPGVNISILNHPEYGQTLSRTDGIFDLAVNGGASLTVSYVKAGYLFAQRTVDVEWEDWVLLDDVRLLQKDDKVSNINLASTTPMQVAQGSQVTDDDGTRQATLLFPQGTQAQVILPGGSTQPVSALHVRTTEYTVGENGPEKMPAELPPTTGYTYCVEISADESVAKIAGKDLLLSQPVPFYLENFVGIPVGWQVPTAYYDNDKAVWVPVKDGKVIKIVSITSGLANIDSDGDGAADDSATLADLGITEAEREQLASLYQEGTELWRVQIDHFSTYDCNYGKGNPKAQPPELTSPNDPHDDRKKKQCELPQNSSIDLQSQVLHETLAVAGTPFTINYSSDRVPGYLVSNVLRIPLDGLKDLSELNRVVIDVVVAGKTTRIGWWERNSTTPGHSLSDIPDFHDFMWDGTDVYGRKLYGSQRAKVRITCQYPAYYFPPPSLRATFGIPGDTSGAVAGASSTAQAVLIEAREPLIYEQIEEVSLSSFKSPQQAVGNWALNIHHVYDSSAQVLYLGDGGIQSGTRKGAWDGSIIDTVAGNDGYSYSCDYDGKLATEIELSDVWNIAASPDGSFYLAGWYGECARRVFRVGRDGIVHTAAGNGSDTFSGDGGPATAAGVGRVIDIAVGSDGSLYLLCWHEWTGSTSRVRRVALDGTITTVAGGGSPEDGLGDGLPATQANIDGNACITVGAEGSLYLTQAADGRLRRVGPDGIINTISGTGCYGYCGALIPDGLSLSQTGVRTYEMVTDSDGNLYFIGARAIYRISPDGFFYRMAGDQCREGYLPKDGENARETCLVGATGLTVARDGSIYYSDGAYNMIRRVSPDGIVTTVAGNPNCIPQLGCAGGYSGDKGLALQAKMDGPWGVDLGPDGSLYIIDQNHRIRRVKSTMPNLLPGELTYIASEDGQEIYCFNGKGQHLRTEDALTGATLYSFAYNGDSLLTQMTDVNGKITTIERDVEGKPTAIVAPFGQRTTVGVDANGYLTSVANPAGEVETFQYNADGLLVSRTDARNNNWTYEYDPYGRVTKDTDPVGGFVQLQRNDLNLNDYEITKTNAIGQISRYKVERLTNGDTQWTNSCAGGLDIKTLFGKDGTKTITSPDGTVTTVTEGPDPRFSTQAPFLSEVTVETPGGLKSTRTAEKTAVMTDAGDPQSAQTITSTSTVNGKTSTEVFDKDSLTITATSPLGRKATTTLDQQGRLVSLQIGNLLPFGYGYDANGHLTSVTHGTRSTTFAYNSKGYLASKTNPLAQVNRFQNDEIGRILELVFPDNEELLFSYDKSGNLTSLTPPEKPAHSFTYTPVDLLERYIAPDLGDGLNTTQTHYNLGRQVTKVQRPDGLDINYTYSDCGRLASTATQSETRTYEYDGVTGNLIAISSTDGSSIGYAYDGSLLTRVTWSGGVAGSVGFTYNNDFKPASVSVNDQNPVTYSYDDDGLLVQAGDLTFALDAQTGLVTGTTLGDTTEDYSYNDYGELTEYHANYSSNPVYETQYTRDDLGRISSKTVTDSTETHAFAYTYDTRGRLTEVKKDGTKISTYTYDANGNRLSYIGSGGTVNATYDSQDRLLTYGNFAYTYTANGELLTKTDTVGNSTTTYSYDEFGNLRKVVQPNGTQIEYVIDPSNRRIGKKVNGTLQQAFLYSDQLNPIAELDGAGKVVSRFIYGSKSNIREYLIKGGNTYRIVTDHLGSPLLIVDVNTGTVAQKLSYDEFGNVLQDTSPGFQPFGFAGGIYDRDTSLVRFGVRDYDPKVGRWTAKDPWGYRGGDSNYYIYCLNNPINLIDPSGLNCKSFKENFIDSWSITNEAIFGGIKNTLYGLFTAGFVADSLGTYSPIMAIVQYMRYGFVGSFGMGLSQVLGSIAINSIVNTMVIAASLEAGITVGSVLNAIIWTYINSCDDRDDRNTPSCSRNDRV